MNRRPANQQEERLDAAITGELVPTGDGRQELAKASSTAMATAEVQAAIIVAMRFPRDEDEAYGKMIKSCKRPTFAEKAVYRFPRGGKEIVGPSVHMAREFARCWRNIRYGFHVISKSDDTCHIRGWAWDMETNAKAEQDATFKLLIYRKQKGGGGRWIKPDERDKRELINKHGAIAERNCLLKLIPSDMIEDFVREVRRNAAATAAQQLDEKRKQIIAAFADYNIEPKQLEAYLGHPLTELTGDDVVRLQEVYAAIRDGQARWSDFASPPKQAGSMADILHGKAAHGEEAQPVSRGFQPWVGPSEDPATKSPPESGTPPEPAGRHETADGDSATSDTPMPENASEATAEPAPAKRKRRTKEQIYADELEAAGSVQDVVKLMERISADGKLKSDARDRLLTRGRELGYIASGKSAGVAKYLARLEGAKTPMEIAAIVSDAASEELSDEEFADVDGFATKMRDWLGGDKSEASTDGSETTETV